MKLMDRDIKIINFIEKNKGATIEQLQQLFFPSYDFASRRLKKLSDNNFLKVKIQPTLGKKVYYLKRAPSFHALVINDIAIQLQGKIKFMDREYKIKNYLVDSIFILKTGKIIICEIDIYNRTSDKKIDNILDALKPTKAIVEVWVVTKGERKKKKNNVRYIEVGKINQVIK